MIKNVSSGVRLKHFDQIQGGIVSSLYLSSGSVIKDHPRSPLANSNYASFSEEFVILPKRDVAPEDDDEDDATDVLVIDRFDAALLFVGRFLIKALFFSRNKSSSSSVSGLALSSSLTR